MGHLIIYLLKLLVWVGDSFPDSARIGWWCLGSGTVLVSAMFVPDQVLGHNELLSDLRPIVSIAGVVCILLGLFVFFRRTVWRLQDRRAKRTISLFGK